MAKANKPPKPPKPGSEPPVVSGKITGFMVQRNLIGIYLQWDPFPGATSYWVHRDQVVPAIIQATSFLDMYVKPGTSYTYYIRAVVNSVIGAQSDSITINF